MATLTSQLDAPEDALKRENESHAKERRIPFEKMMEMKKWVNEAMDEGLKAVFGDVVSGHCGSSVGAEPGESGLEWGLRRRL